MITHEGIEYLTYSDLRPGCIYHQEVELLGQAEHNRDLFSQGSDGPGHSIPAGRLEEGQQPPEGTKVVSNKHGNLWWAKFEGRVMMVCLDAMIDKRHVKFPDDSVS